MVFQEGSRCDWVCKFDDTGKEKCFKDAGKGFKNQYTSKYWKHAIDVPVGNIWNYMGDKALIHDPYKSVITRGFALKRFGLTHQIFSPNSGPAWLKIGPTESLTSAFRLQVA